MLRVCAYTRLRWRVCRDFYQGAREFPWVARIREGLDFGSAGVRGSAGNDYEHSACAYVGHGIGAEWVGNGGRNGGRGHGIAPTQTAGIRL
jgi:hypothetical protein